MEEYKDTTVIIPTLNEEENITELLNLITKNYNGIKIIVSDDGSKDKTQEIVKSQSKKNKNIMILDRSKERIHGLTASVYDAAKKTKTEYVVVIDGDLQHPPEKIKEIVKELRKGYNIVVGAREKVFYWPFSRKIISKTAMILGKARLFINGAKCRDILSGFFGIKREKITNIKQEKFEMYGYKVLFDILKNTERKAKIKNVYYVFGARKKGHSKIGLKHIISFAKALFK
ncbi:MAG: glycosyltransferase [Candidatus Nanoarchaeia archaeon]|nr:glycosyltransferase [Candidatus Nanoarchaeia archaeon]